MRTLVEVTLGEISENFDKRRIPLSSSQRANLAKTYRYFGAQGVIDYVNDYIFDGEYILVAEDGENLKSNKNNICQLVTGKFWVNNHAHIIKAAKGNNTKYLCYLLNHINLRPYITGSAQPKLTKDNLNRIKLNTHEQKAQEKIADVLSSLDEKTDLNKQINAELEAIAKLLYDYWFVQFDFPMTAAQAASLGRPALEGHPYKSSGGKMVHNPALNRQIPEGWTVSSVSSFSKLNELVWTDKTAPASLKYVDLANTKNGEIQEVTDYKWADAPSRARRKLRAGDTIVGTVRPGNRSYCLVPKSENVLTGSTGFAVLTPAKDCYREFNYLSLTSATNINRLTTLASGAAYPAVNPDVVASYEMPFPPESLVDRYHATVKDSFDLMQINQKQNQELTQLRDWLLPMLMNGQVTVGA